MEVHSAVQRFRGYVQRRNDSVHTLDRDTLDLHLFFRDITTPLEQVSFREVDRFIDTQHALRIDQGKGRKDRQVYLSVDAVASVRECLQRRPGGVPGDAVFWHRKRPNRPLSVKAIQKKMARYAKAAGGVASCHRLRHPFASNLLEEGAEMVSMKELLGHVSITSSERYARVSNQRVTQVYLQTMQKVLQHSKV